MSRNDCARTSLGEGASAEKMRPLLQDAPPDPNILRRERNAAGPSLDVLSADVTHKATRDQRISDAVREHHHTLQEVGDHVGLHFSTISVIPAQVAEAQGIRRQRPAIPAYAPYLRASLLRLAEPTLRSL